MLYSPHTPQSQLPFLGMQNSCGFIRCPAFLNSKNIMYNYKLLKRGLFENQLDESLEPYTPTKQPSFVNGHNRVRLADQNQQH